MATRNKALIIAYAGSLKGGRTVRHKKTILNKIKTYFWTYQPQNIDPATRTGSYLIEAISILRDKYKVPKELLKVKLWGAIDKQNQIDVNILNLSEYISIEDFKSKQETKQLLAEADILFLPLEKGKVDQKPLFIPGKLFEYLNLGKPILALSENSECADILKESGLGIIAPPDKPEEIAQILYEYISNENLLSEIQANKEYIAQFSFRKKTRMLADIFDKLLE